ncbi:MAG: DUF2067 family protein [Infirmifilum sp.]|uniref:DUF2067 family protein n=1 Tax=Infirmifilum TaxID=2856573 RepID=UPI002357C204
MRGTTFTLVFSSPEEALEFLKMLEKILPGKSFLGELKTNKVKVFVPESENSEQVIRKIRELYNQKRRPYAYGLVKDYDISTVFSLSRLEQPIPLSLLITTLRIQGYKAEAVRDKLRTNAPLDHLTKMVEKLSKLYGELLEIKATAQARRLIALYSLTKNLPTEEAIRQLSEQGFLTEDRGRISLKLNYETALRIIFQKT